MIFMQFWHVNGEPFCGFCDSLSRLGLKYRILSFALLFSLPLSEFNVVCTGKGVFYALFVRSIYL